MNARERWLAVLEGSTPDRLPMDYWATAETNARLMAHLGCSDMAQVYDRLHIDPLISVGPRYAGPPIAPDADMYGARYVQVHHDGGSYRECVHYPLAAYDSVEQIAREYTWPSVDWFDYSGIRDQVGDRAERYLIRGGGSEPFLVYANHLRGVERAYMDLLENREMVEYCLDKLFDFAYENTTRIYEQVPVDISYVAEDFGSQTSLLISPRIIREVFIPRMKRMIDLAHEAGARVFFHSDGAIRPIIPDMIATGIDILNPIQWRCTGMDRASLKADFGDQVVFHGGVDNQETLAFGTVEDVRAEVAANIEILGAGGGYILAPCHNIQVISPPENIVAMYEAGYELGRA
jgi:uroporphyrinogen decarboxylase